MARACTGSNEQSLQFQWVETYSRSLGGSLEKYSLGVVSYLITDLGGGFPGLEDHGDPCVTDTGFWDSLCPLFG